MQRVDVPEMLAEMTSEQFSWWVEHYQLEPWGSREMNRLLASIAAFVANQWRKGSPVMPEDLAPYLRRKRKKQRRQTPQEAAEIMRRFCVAYGGTVN